MENNFACCCQCPDSLLVEEVVAAIYSSSKKKVAEGVASAWVAEEAGESLEPEGVDGVVVEEAGP